MSISLGTENVDLYPHAAMYPDLTLYKRNISIIRSQGKSYSIKEYWMCDVINAQRTNGTSSSEDARFEKKSSCAV